MMRGRILKVGARRSEDIKAKENVAWVLEGDRGITYAASVPDGSTLAEGKWWPADYAGPPLVSIDAEVAKGLGLAIGDPVTVNVLGRSLVATIANTRTVNWRSFGINFVLVFSPNTFAGAPHTDLATLTFPGGADTATETRLVRDVAAAFPAVTTIRVKEALEAVNDLVGQLALAIRGASGVALAASVLVLAGALAAGQRRRIYDAVVLKTLGATRGRLLAAHLLEYGLLGTRHGRLRRAGRRGGRLCDRYPPDGPGIHAAVALGARGRGRRIAGHDFCSALRELGECSVVSRLHT